MRPDGTPYTASGTLQQFNPESATHCLLNKWDAELIKLGGSPIYYYELFIQPGSIDPIYREDRGKIWSNFPIQLYALYEPAAQVNYRNQFGTDGMDEQVFSLNYEAVLAAIGHPPTIGSRIFTPHKSEHWKIVQRNTGEFRLWGELRLELICQKFQEDAVTGAGAVTQAPTDFQLHPVSKPGCT